MNIKKLPYGASNFETVILKNYCYVDKTKYIEMLENEANRYHFFIRPRKFGKSLFFTTLYHYYDLAQAEKFQQLFGNLYVGQHPTTYHSSYLMMTFDFSGLKTDTKENFVKDFDAKIEETILDFFSAYAHLIADAKELSHKVQQSQRGSVALRIAFRAAHNINKKIFVLIDEYDHFANDLIALGVEEIYKGVVRANGVVRDFYETLKEGTKSVVDRIFITGISPVMMDDLTSGFNIAENLTRVLNYNEMMGFNENEVNWLMQQTGVDKSLINVDMQAYYNGYLFHPDGEHKLYNPSMLMFFFGQIVREHKVPKQLVDDNLKTDYGRIERLVQNTKNHGKLEEILKNGGVTANVLTKFSIDRLYDDEYFISLLYYMGLLTYGKNNEGFTFLKIPNYSVETLYWEYIFRLIVNLNEKVEVNESEMLQGVRELAFNGDPQRYLKYVSNYILKNLSNRDLMKFDEKYIKFILLHELLQSEIYVPKSEYEIPNGYADIYMKRSPLMPNIPYEWLWEIKYLPESRIKSLENVKKDALKQIDKYRQAPEFKDRKDVKFASIIFIGKRKFEIIEYADNSIS